MPEIVGTTTSFDLPVDEIIEQALESLGGEHVSAKEMRQARTALNLLFVDLQNRGMAPLASLQIKQVPLVSGSSENYTMSADVFNTMDMVLRVRTSASAPPLDLNIERISYSRWLEIPTKEIRGRPTHVFVNRQRDNVKLNFWPVPDNDTYTLLAWSLVRIADVTKSYQLVGLPHRYLPAIVKGLTYYMSPARGASLEERNWLKAEYLEALQIALDEDRERVDFTIYPTYRTQLNS